MENKIAINSLAASLAAATGKSKKICEDFLREYFRIVTDCMENGETLKIKGFGTFKVTEVEGRTGVNVATGESQEIAPYKKVVFSPAKNLAEEINAPFLEFESVEMEDEIPEEFFYEDQPADEDSVDKPADEDNIETGILEAGSEEEGEDDDITYEAYKDLENTDRENSDLENKDSENKETSSEPEEQEQPPVEIVNIGAHAPEPEEEEKPIVLPVYDDDEDDDEEETVKSRFGLGFLTGSLSTFAVCAVIFMLGCFFDWWPVNFVNPKVFTETPIEIESPANVEVSPETVETPEAEPVYDTVSNTRFLTTIAREHYGNFNFWPYIYLENQAILGHPDRITPGTKVVVPDLSKYNVNPENKDDVEAAKKLSAEIYARFK